MNEAVESAPPVDSNRSTIRSQLLWASLFPLVFFGLLSTLATSSALSQMMLNLVDQRNTAQVQLLADSLARDLSAGEVPAADELNATLQTLKPVSGSQLFVIDPQGELIASSDPKLSSLPFNQQETWQLIQGGKPASQLIESGVTLDKMVVSYTEIQGGEWGVILAEPWAANMAPAYYYQLILVGLLGLGTMLSLGMLTLSIGRVIRPIAMLAENASKAVPGSIFYPVIEHGPKEIRLLINAFNKMVIRLAEQQSVTRQYAQKALLSQEEERQRLSHELHDGTLQDLVGLVQRVELCRNELERDPLLARQRLDELHTLIEQTLDNVRRISSALRPPVLEDFGLAVALEALCEDLKRDKPALQCTYAISGLARRLNPDLELAAYRVVQEALANIRKHAQDATTVDVKLVFGEAEIQTMITNDGSSFTNQDIRSLVRSGHLGLAGMYERARLFGGTLNIESEPGENTRVLLQLPCSQELSPEG